MKRKTPEPNAHGANDQDDPALADTLPGTKPQQRKAETAGANGQRSRKARGRAFHDEQSDPEKVRLVAEVNAVWRRLEEEEDKRQRLGEEVEELHLALAEEQRARSSAAREKRAAEQREAAAVRELYQLKSERDQLRSRLQEELDRAGVRRKQLFARGAATAGGLFGLALVVRKALGRSASRPRSSWS